MTMFSSCVVILISLMVLGQADPLPSNDAYTEDMAKRKEMALECIKELKIDGAMIMKVLNQQIESHGDTSLIPRENKDYRDFLTCSYKKQGYQAENGSILYETMKDFLSRFYERSDLKRIDVCKESEGKETDHGEIAVNSMICVMNKLKELDKERLEAFEDNEI